MTSSSTFLIGVATTGIMGMGGYYMMLGEMTTGDFLFFTLILGFMIAPIVQMSNIGSQLTEALAGLRSEEHTSELQSRPHLVCRLLLEKTRPPPTLSLFSYTTLFRSHSFDWSSHIRNDGNGRLLHDACRNDYGRLPGRHPNTQVYVAAH